MVVLVPDAQVRESVRALASSQPVEGVQASIYVADELVDACVRDTRRALFDGPLAVLARDEASSLRALAAGADEAYSLASIALDAAAWLRLVARARVKSEARRASGERLAAVSELERLCALGRLAAGVAEELSAPLTSALLALEALERELGPLYATIAELQGLCASEALVSGSELREIVAKARSASTPERARAMLGEVHETCQAVALVARDLGLSDGGHERHEWLDVGALLERVLRLFQRAAGKRACIERDYAGELPEVFAPRARLAQVLISLCSNAWSSLRAVDRDVHRLRIGLCADAAVVTITVSDNGPGLAPEVLASIFDPSATRATTRLGPHGSGLELAVARSTMRALGGDLMVESLRGEGTTFVAWLPRPEERSLQRCEFEARARANEPHDAFARHASPATLGASPHRSHAGPHAERPCRSVLLFEPDRQVLGALSKLLGERYEVLIAPRGERARALIANGARPDAIVAACDDAEGHEFVEWLLLERPDLSRRLLLTTGNAEPGDRLSGLPWLEKPLDPAALYRVIDERCVEARDGAGERNYVAPLRNTRPRLQPRDTAREPSQEAGAGTLDAASARSPRPEAC